MRFARVFRWMGGSLVALAGCASSARTTAELEAQLRAMRATQEQYVQRIAQLESRLAAAERCTRESETIAHHRVVRIVDDTAQAVDSSDVEGIPSALNEEWPDSSSPAEDPSRPIVRMQGRAASSPAGPGFVVRQEERLPVAPVPPVLPVEQQAQPAQSPSTTPAPSRPASSPDAGARESGRGSSAMGPERTVPLGATANLTQAPLGEGTSSVRDPRSTAAYDAALAEVRDGQCARAIDSFANFLVRWPDHPHAASAMYWRGECLLATGDTRRAIEQFEGALARSSSANLSSGLLFKLAQSHRRLGDMARARLYAERLQREFPTSDAAQRARAEESR